MAHSFVSTSSQRLSYAGAQNAYPYTMACWAYRSGSVTQGIMGMQSTGGTHYGANLNAATSILQHCQGGNASTGQVTVSGFTANTWHHVCGISSAANAHSVYLNGSANKATGTGNWTNFTSANETNFGGRYKTTGVFQDYLDGRICHAAIWTVALTDAEVDALAAGWSPMLIRPAALWAYWPLGGFHGDTDNDKWSNGYNLTASGSPAFVDQPPIIYPWMPTVVTGGGGGGGGAAKPVLFHSHYQSQGMRP